MDYTGELDAPIDFLLGDFSGVSRCTNITILDDSIVENGEIFNAFLKENSSRLEIESSRNTTRITIMEDNDCKYIQISQREHEFLEMYSVIAPGVEQESRERGVVVKVAVT